MKKIYTITLDESDPLSGGFKDNLRIIATMVYYEIDSLFFDGITPLDKSKQIVRNKLHYLYDASLDYNRKFNYKLDSDLNDDKKVDYEPFIVGARTFAFTIIDDNFGEEELKNIVLKVFRLFNFSYGISIGCYPYETRGKFARRRTVKTIENTFLSWGHKDHTRKRVRYFGKLGKTAI